MRKVDVGMIINILTLFGLLGAFYSHPMRWDQAVRDVDEMKPKVSANAEKLAAINAQYEDIKDELHAINRKLGR